jgi:hypothetical protein
MSLQNLIIQEAHSLDEKSKQNLVRHLQKCTKAFKKSSAQAIIQEDRIKFLTTINNEAKVRRSTRSLVLGKAKVMSYEDLVEARAKRVVKDAARAAKGKGKRGRKRKSGTLEAEEDTAEEDTAEEDTAGSVRRGRKRNGAALDGPAPANKTARIRNAPKPASTLMRQASRTQTADNEIAPEPQRVPEPQRAPVARMW